MSDKRQYKPTDIAIVGVSCRFPGAKNIEEYWANLRDGVDCISRFSDEELLANGVEPEMVNNPRYVKANGTIPDIEMFDAGFFGYSPREAKMMDVQHRIFMECAWEALEDAGYDTERFKGLVGVYGGNGLNTYLLRNVYPQDGHLEALEQFQLMIASDKDYITTRVSFKFNLMGPSIDVQTSCSTSLVAVHLACQSLITNETDLAIAGGIAVRPPLRVGYLFREGMIFSPDGYCRAFDSKAGGTVNSNGVGVVVLRRMEDALRDGDTILAVIKGTAINNDGAHKSGYTAPSSEGQAGAIWKAIERAQVDVETITYVEAHGTATILGDPIEVAGLTRAFRNGTQRRGFCALGSVKASIGHTDVAAGMAALIKVVQMLRHKQIPPSLHYEQPNPNIDFDSTPFFVNTQLRDWTPPEGTPRRAGVSSFGVGGTNAHAVLEEAPELEPSSESRPWQLAVFSAKTPTALDNMTINFGNHLKKNPQLDLADAAYTLQTGRRQFDRRRFVVVADVEDAVQTLEGLDSDRIVNSDEEEAPRQRPVMFMFPGQGAQYVNMARGLYLSEPTFRERVHYCCEVLKPHLGLDLRDVLFPPADKAEEATRILTQTAITQPALFVIEYALARLWMEWGIYPQAMLGHSIGEYVAAHLAGVFSLDDALALVAARGRLIQQQQPGTMLAVPLPETDVLPLLNEELSLSVINGVSLCVVGGPTEAIEALEKSLSGRGINTTRLHTSHAFHSTMMQDAVEPFIEIVSQVKLNPPQMPYLSNVTGTWITAKDATDPAYWASHMRNTVRFADGLGELLNEYDAVLLEVGPGQTLTTLAKQHPSYRADTLALPSVRHPRDNRPDVAFLLSTLGRLWLTGVEIDWRSFYARETRRRIPLPTYPFEREAYWIDQKQTATVAQFAPSQSAQPTNGDTAKRKTGEYPARGTGSLRGTGQLRGTGTLRATGSLRSPEDIERIVKSIWQETVGVRQVSNTDNFFDLGGNSLMAAGLLAQIERATGKRIALSAFFQGPTVGSMIKLLQESGPVMETQSYVIPLKPGDPERPPFFWLHGTDFGNFSRFLPDWLPFYLLPPPGMEDSTPMVQDVEEFLAYYLAEIRKVQPTGPYHIGGYCMGGVISYALAEKLVAQGEEVPFLALIDADPPDQQWIARFQKTAGQHYLDRLIHNLRTGHLIRTITGKLREAAEERAARLFGGNEARRLQEIVAMQDRAFKGYSSPGAPLRAQIYECEEYVQTRDDDLHGRWVRLAQGGLDHYIIPGNHTTMLRSPNVELMVDIMTRLLEGESVPSNYEPAR